MGEKAHKYVLRQFCCNIFHKNNCKKIIALSYDFEKLLDLIADFHPLKYQARRFIPTFTEGVLNQSVAMFGKIFEPCTSIPT